MPAMRGQICLHESGSTWARDGALPTHSARRCPGWLVLVPRRHTVALDDLTADEAADLGPLLRAVSSALRDVVRCRKTYVALFAEAEGFQHIHFHIIPRQPGLEADLRGPRVFGLLGGDPAG